MVVAMAVVAAPQFLFFSSESNWRITTTTSSRTCLPLPHFNSILLRSRNNKIHFPLISCSSSSSQTPETQTQTAESCVNLGLHLFSKGKV
jgi:hypothetical protein